ncbi:MAG: hypothetical protein J6Q22_11580 [Prevotella sp.]|nr:hypothetical protein [Prevotella sp.]
MNNEKILNIMENLSKAVYDIAATTKHIYKDEHPTGPTMPMPTMPGHPKLPTPPAPCNLFPPALNCQDAREPMKCPPPVVVRQPERYGGLGFRPLMKPKEPCFDKQRPMPAGPNQFCNMQDYTFQQMNGNVPSDATILADPFMKPNQKVNLESNPDYFGLDYNKNTPIRMKTMVDTADGHPEPIANLIKEHPTALDAAKTNVQKMNPSLGICQNLSNGKIEQEIESLTKSLNEMTLMGKPGSMSDVSNRLVGLTFARTYLNFPPNETGRKFIANELKTNPVALKAFNDAIDENEGMRAKAIAERLYESQRFMSQSGVSVGKDLKASMDNFFNPKPDEWMAKQVDLPTTPQDFVKAAMTKKYLKSIDAKESVGKMTDMLDKCNELAKSPAVPGDDVMKEAETSLTEENLKKDASEIKADDRPVIPEKEETPEIPETPVVPDPDEPKKEVKKEIKKKIKKEVKKESEAPEKTEENTQVTAAGAW